MLNLKKTLKLAALAIVLGAAVPAMTSAASAAPAGHYDVQRVAQNDRFDGRHDFRGHRFEHRGWYRHHEFRHHWR